jgi:hypothetical protein
MFARALRRSTGGLPGTTSVQTAAKYRADHAAPHAALADAEGAPLAVLGAGFPLVAVPLAWYVLGVAGAALQPLRVSPLTVFAVIRGAAIWIVATWIVTRWLALPGSVAALVVLGAIAIALVVRARIGSLRMVLVPERRDLPMLALATVLLSVWIAPVTRHGLGAIGTGNHADLPSYLLQASYLFNHGFDASGALPGIHPEERMFDAFGANALLAPSTAISAAPSIGVMAIMILGAVLVGQLVDRVSSRALGGARIAPLLVGATLLMSWAFTFNAFAYFLAQVWGLAFGLGLIAALLSGERGVPAAVSAMVVSVAGILTYNPTGAMYAVVAVVLGGWLVAMGVARRRPVLRSPELGLAAGVALGGIVFIPVWHLAVDRLWLLRDAVAGWPMPTAPLWAAVGVPIAERGNSTPVIVAGSCALALVAAAGWLSSARGRRVLLRFWPLAIPCAVWLYRAWQEPGSYQQWKAFSYAQPVLIVAVACGLVLLAQRATGPLRALRTGRARGALPAAVAAGLLACAAAYAFWPRSYFADGGCCIASGDQIAQIQSGAERSPGRVRVSAGHVWSNDVAGAIISLTRPVSIDPPSIWPSQVVEPLAGTVTFETGAHPSFVEGRFAFQPAPTS